MVFLGIRTSIARKPCSVVIFQGGGSGPPIPSGSAHGHTHSLARAFTACLLKVVDIQVRKLSTPSPKDVDCILASYIAYKSSNKTQFFQWSYMYIISQFTVKAQTSLHISQSRQSLYSILFEFNISWFLTRHEAHIGLRKNRVQLNNKTRNVTVT